MAILVTCPKGHRLRVNREFAGKSAVCPKCKTAFRIAIPSETPAPEFVDGESPTAEPTSAQDNCPNCGSKLASGSLLCVSCGLDLRTGKVRRGARLQADRRVTLRGRPRGTRPRKKSKTPSMKLDKLRHFGISLVGTIILVKVRKLRHLGILLVAMAGAAIAYSSGEIYRNSKALKWPTTKGTVIDVEYHGGSGGRAVRQCLIRMFRTLVGS